MRVHDGRARAGLNTGTPVTQGSQMYQRPTVERFGTLRELTLKQDAGFDLAMSQGCEENAAAGGNDNAMCIRS